MDPSMQRQIVGMVDSGALGKQGIDALNKLTEGFMARAGVRNPAGIIGPSNEQKRLSAEIKAIRDAGTKAGAAIASQTQASIDNMAGRIEALHGKFLVDLLNLFRENEIRQTHEDIETAKVEMANYEKLKKLHSKISFTRDVSPRERSDAISWLIKNRKEFSAVAAGTKRGEALFGGSGKQ